MTVHSAFWRGLKARKNNVTHALFLIFPQGINNKSLRCTDESPNDFGKNH